MIHRYIKWWGRSIFSQGGQREGGPEGIDAARVGSNNGLRFYDLKHPFVFINRPREGLSVYIVHCVSKEMVNVFFSSVSLSFSPYSCTKNDAGTRVYVGQAEICVLMQMSFFLFDARQLSRGFSRETTFLFICVSLIISFLKKNIN